MKNRTTFSLQPRAMVAFLRIIQIEIAIAAVMLCAMAILAMMALAKFNSTLAEVTDSRISVILYDMRGNIEQGLALGVQLSALDNTGATIQRAARRDPKIAAIYVLGRQGETLYRSPAAAPELGAEAAAGFARATQKKAVASSRQGGMINTVSVLQNSFSQTVGLLVLKYDASALQQRFDTFQQSFLRQALYFLLAGLALTTLTTWLVLRRFETTDRRLAQALAGAQGGDGEPAFVQFRQQERAVLAALADAEKALEIK